MALTVQGAAGLVPGRPRCEGAIVKVKALKNCYASGAALKAGEIYDILIVDYNYLKAVGYVERYSEDAGGEKKPAEPEAAETKAEPVETKPNARPKRRGRPRKAH